MSVVFHVSQFFQPAIGGQEKIVNLMCEIHSKSNGWSIVLQPLSPKLLVSLFKKDLKLPRRTLVIPIPIAGTLIKAIDRIWFMLTKSKIHSESFAREVDWISFNWSLKIIRPLFRLINSVIDSKFVIHYHYHQPAFSIKNTIIFSHGVEWMRPPTSSLDKIRVKYIKKVISDNNVDLIIANDRDYIEELCQVNKDAIKKIEYIPNPVNTAIFAPKKNADEQLKNKNIVIIRNVRRDRGILEGINAFKKFVQDSECFDWTLNVYGFFNPSDQYYIECLRSAESDDRIKIKMHGHLKSELVGFILHSSTLSLVPSQGLEGTSLTALESMATGVPCISTPVGGLLDIPTFKSETLSSDSIADAINNVLKNYKKIREHQKEQTVKNYSLIDWEKKINNVFSGTHSKI